MLAAMHLEGAGGCWPLEQRGGGFVCYDEHEHDEHDHEHLASTRTVQDSDGHFSRGHRWDCCGLRVDSDSWVVMNACEIVTMRFEAVSRDYPHTLYFGPRDAE